MFLNQTRILKHTSYMQAASMYKHQKGLSTLLQVPNTSKNNKLEKIFNINVYYI